MLFCVERIKRNTKKKKERVCIVSCCIPGAGVSRAGDGCYFA